MYNIIRKKRDGKELSREEIFKVIEKYVSGEVPDYQISAFLMAIYFKGMTDSETAFLTEAMARSGDMVDLSQFGELSADKHSTGGVGDKTTLIVIPIAAALGCKVAKMSGRGLGHTGGTADKMEAVPGYRITMPAENFMNQVAHKGIALVTQSGNLAPADKMIYALRDVTATVESMPLIASSIMSKKIAAGAKNIVLDVKVGSGAFMKNTEDAKELAEIMVSIGKSCNRNVRAVITDMDTPLGNAVGNTLEVIEAVELLRGKGDKKLLDVSCTLAAHMVSMALEINEKDALQMTYESVKSGKAYEKFCEWIGAQGGDLKYIENPSLFERAKFTAEIIAPEDGYIAQMDTEKIGRVCVALGGGRQKKDDIIDYAAGILMDKKTGDPTRKGEVIARLYTNNEKALGDAVGEYLDAIVISDKRPKEKPLVYEVVG